MFWKKWFKRPPQFESEADFEKFVKDFKPKHPFVQADKSEIWASLDDGLTPLIDEADGLLDSMYDAGHGGNAVSKFPVSIVASFYLDMRSALPKKLHPILEQYAEYWMNRNASVKISRINRRRDTLFGQSAVENTLLNQTRFLAYDSEWETQQDGVFFYICWSFCEADVDRRCIQAALENVISRYG